MLSCTFRFMCISPHPFILISSGSCVLACIFASSHTDTFGFMGAYWHPHILASSYSKVHMCLLEFWYPHIIISWGSCVFAWILASSHPHVLRFLCIWLYLHILTSLFHFPRFVYVCLYSRILTSSYPQVHSWLLVCLLPHILRFMCVSSYPSIISSSYAQIRVCFLVSSDRHIPRRLGWCGPVCWLISSHPHIIIVLCPNTLAISVSYVLVGTLVSHTFTPLGSCILVCLHVPFRALLELKGLYRCLDSFFR